jgi:hypothetical protein
LSNCWAQTSNHSCAEEDDQEISSEEVHEEEGHDYVEEVVGVNRHTDRMD